LHAMSEEFVQVLEHIERALASVCNRGIAAQNLEIKTIAVERDYARVIFEFGNQLQRVILEPVPECVVLVPGDCNCETKRPNIVPAAIYFVRQADRFDIQINFAIE